jgi:hypothetical protein
MISESPKNKHGGARKGAGRKKGRTKPFLICMLPETMQVIRSEAKACELMLGELLDRRFAG